MSAPDQAGGSKGCSSGNQSLPLPPRCSRPERAAGQQRRAAPATQVLRLLRRPVVAEREGRADLGRLCAPRGQPRDPVVSSLYSRWLRRDGRARRRSRRASSRMTKRLPHGETWAGLYPRMTRSKIARPHGGLFFAATRARRAPSPQPKSSPARDRSPGARGCLDEPLRARPASTARPEADLLTPAPPAARTRTRRPARSPRRRCADQPRRVSAPRARTLCAWRAQPRLPRRARAGSVSR